MLVRVVHKNVRISPRKAIHVCRLVNRKSLSEAYKILERIPWEKTVKLLLKLFKEASHNAVHNYALNGDNLEIEECVALKGSMLKRTFPRAKGRADIRIHRLSHLSVVLKEGQKASSRVQKKSKSKSIKVGQELGTKRIEQQMKEEV